jgi:hypothetical protein
MLSLKLARALGEAQVANTTTATTITTAAAATTTTTATGILCTIAIVLLLQFTRHPSIFAERQTPRPSSSLAFPLLLTRT